MAEKIQLDKDVLDVAADEGSQTRPLRTEYVLVENEFARIDGVLRKAGGDAAPAVLIQTHPRRASAMNLSAWPMLRLPPLGVDTFAFNNRVTNSAAGTEVITVWEDLALDVAAAVAEMRRRGYRHVILYGTSAGGPLVSYYQNVAEHGNDVFGGGAALSGFTGFERDGKALRLPPADAIISQNSTTGTGYSFLMRLDGAIVDEAGPVRDPELDLFASEHGYDPGTGEAHYTESFLRRYAAAQVDRMERLIASAQERLEACRLGRGYFLDDELIVVPGIRGEPSCVDRGLAARSSVPGRLYPSGRSTIVESRRRVVPSYALRNARYRDGGTVHTLRSFLSYRAVRADRETFDPDATHPAASGVDLASMNSSTAGNVSGVSVPLLITASTGDTQVHLPAAELMLNAAVATDDRQIAYIEGGEHDMTPIAPEYGDTRAHHLALLGAWLEERFPIRG